MGIQVSVVVPTYRRAACLDRCLQALLAQNFDSTAYEILIVDDANDPETRQVVSKWSVEPRAYQLVSTPGHIQLDSAGNLSRSGIVEEPVFSSPFGLLACIPQIRYIPVPVRRGPAAARNLGWRSASGRIIAFTDDDCLPDPDWLKNGVKSFSDGVVGCSGRVLVPLHDDPTDFEKAMSGLESSPFVTANCFYRRSVLQSVGGFDESFSMPWREDSELFFRLLKAEYRLVTAQEALVVHPVRPAAWGISLKQQRKSMYNALIFKKHPKLYREILQPSPPWDYYLIVASMAAVGFGLLAGLPWLVFLAGTLWLSLTLLFCLRRLKGTTHRFSHVAEMALTSALIPPLSIFWRIWGAVKFRVFFL